MSLLPALVRLQGTVINNNKKKRGGGFIHWDKVFAVFDSSSSFVSNTKLCVKQIFCFLTFILFLLQMLFIFVLFQRNLFFLLIW